MKTPLPLAGCITLAASLMFLISAFAQGPGDGFGPPPGGPGMMPPPGGPGQGPGPFGPRPDQLDANGDGEITNAEYSAAWKAVIAEQFMRLDADNNGRLSKEELAKAHGPERGPRGGAQGTGDTAGAPPPPPPDGQKDGRRPPMRPPRPTMDEMDPDKDGTVTCDEYSLAWVKATQNQFSEMDANKDGVLNREEMKKAHGPGPGHRGPGSGTAQP